MFANYFKIVIRIFLKDRTISLINISGLSIGLASVIMILSYVRYELSYDKHYSNSDRVYRLVRETTKAGIIKESVQSPEGLATALKNDYPEITDVTYAHVSKLEFSFLPNRENINVNALWGDSQFLKVFNLPFKYGNPQTALTDDHNIVITEHIADAYFPNRNPVGEVINDHRFDKRSTWIISGVIKDIPSNTHFKADVIFASNKIDDLNWIAFGSLPQYICLQNKTALPGLENKLKSFYSKHNFPPGEKIKFQPVESIHLHSNLPDEGNVNGDIRYIYIFSLSALLILFIACINYTNLTTARSLQRIKEVGVRKVLGAARKQLSLQFIGESFLFFCTAVPFSLLIAHLFWPIFVKILNIDVSNNYLLSSQNIIFIFIISIISGVVSGIYPSLFLSHLQPATILKDQQKGFKINLGIRKTLIVFQFVISVTLIITIIVIFKQLSFMNNMPLGFNKDYVVVLSQNNFRHHAGVFKSKLEQNNNIQSVTIASWKIGEYYGFSSGMDNPKDTTRELKFDFVDADFDFLKTMQIKLLDGRNFSSLYPTDLVNIDSLIEYRKYTNNTDFVNTLSLKPLIISENTVKTLGFKKPIGEVLKLGALQGTVIGVIKDIQGLTLHKPTSSLVLRAKNENTFGYTYIRISSQNIPSTLKYIESTWKAFFPASRFDFAFLDERLQKMYDSERRLASLFTVFAVLAICIACSGLFSLVALNVRQRTKEIGIRKVLGADVTEIVRLIIKDFVKLIIIAILIASPIAWYAMNKWLENFAFRIEVSWWIFFLSSAVALFIALITISIQAVRAAMANPIKSLKTE